MIPARITVATLGYRDFDLMRGFYERLGWQSSSPDGEFARFKTGGATLCLYPTTLLGGEAGGQQPPDTAGYRGVTLAVNVEERDEVDSAFATAIAAGATPLAEPVDRDWGGRSAYFADPEGNAWEIAWVPDSSIGPEGTLTWP